MLSHVKKCFIFIETMFLNKLPNTFTAIYPICYSDDIHPETLKVSEITTKIRSSTTNKSWIEKANLLYFSQNMAVLSIQIRMHAVKFGRS